MTENMQFTGYFRVLDMTRNNKFHFLKSKLLHNKVFHSWHSNNEGVTAIEFAMVAPIFFPLLLMIIETGIVFTGQQLLDTSVMSASRQVLTGATQSNIATKGNSAVGKDFRKQVCDGMSGLIDAATCDATVMIDMKVFGSSTTAASAATIATSLELPLEGNIPSKDKMKCAYFGGSNAYMLIRAYYQYPVYVSYLSKVPHSSEGHSLLVGSVATKLEPFGGTGSAAPENNC
jgi:Flp pilus assembly protein TadG